jgi:hypothetical protein
MCRTFHACQVRLSYIISLSPAILVFNFVVILILLIFPLLDGGCIGDCSGNTPVIVAISVGIISFVSFALFRVAFGAKSSSPTRTSKETEMKELAPHSSNAGRAQVLFDFTMEDERTLPCLQGDVVTLLGTPREGWVEAEKDGLTGLVPLNHLAILPDEPSQHPSVANDAFGFVEFTFHPPSSPN